LGETALVRNTYIMKISIKSQAVPNSKLVPRSSEVIRAPSSLQGSGETASPVRFFPEYFPPSVLTSNSKVVLSPAEVLSYSRYFSSGFCGARSGGKKIAWQRRHHV